MASIRELVTKIVFKTDTSGVQKAEKETKKLKKSLNDTEKAAEQMGDSLSSSVSGVSAPAGQGASAIRRIGAAAQAAASVAGGALQSLQRRLDSVATAAERAKNKVKSINPKKVGDKGGEIAKGGMELAAAGAAVSAPAVLSVKTAADFQEVMSKVKAITNSTDEDMSLLTKTARDLGASTKYSATEAGEAMTYLGMAGWKTEQIIAGMPGLLDLAAASGEDLARVSDIVSDDLTAFGMDASQAGHMADVMAAASTNANTNVSLMGDTFKYAGAVAGALKYSFEDVALATGLMANAGIKGEQAGTSLRAIMSRLVSPPKEAADAMNALGIKVTNTDGTMKPFRQTMKELRMAFSSLTDAQKAEMASSMAGQEAMSGFLSVINASDTDFNKLAEAVDNSEGAAHNMAKTMNDNAKGALKELQSAAEEVAIELGESLLPVLSEIIRETTGFAQGLGAFTKEHPKLVAGIMAVISAVGALLVFLGTLGILVGGIMQLAPVFSAIATALGTVASIGLAPILAIIAAISAVIYTVSEYWDELVEWFQPGIDEMMNGLDLLSGAWYNLQPLISALFPLLKFIATIIGGAIVGVIWVLFRVASFVFNVIASLINGIAYALGKMGDLIHWCADKLVGLIGKAKEYLGLQDQMQEGAVGNATSEWAQRAISGQGNNTYYNNNGSYTFNVPNEGAMIRTYDRTQLLTPYS